MPVLRGAQYPANCAADVLGIAAQFATATYARDPGRPTCAGVVLAGIADGVSIIGCYRTLVASAPTVSKARILPVTSGLWARWRMSICAVSRRFGASAAGKSWSVPRPPGNGVPWTCSVVRLLVRLPCVGRPGTVGRCDPVDAGQGLYLLWRGNTEQPESGAEHSGRQVAQHEA